MQVSQRAMSSPIGRIYLTASDRGLRSLTWDNPQLPLETDQHHLLLNEAEQQITEYLTGIRQKFSLQLDMQGTPFQIKVWQSLLKIPFGSTESYRELASQIANPGAARAVGTANGKNPLCLVIPCHRVIAADGSLGGYSGGLDRKRFLLDLEASYGA